ncbi:MAG: flagellar FliJ family protein [Bacillota bacterium]|nr:flagellar FliJ family protein [Bacillota bacterium]
MKGPQRWRRLQKVAEIREKMASLSFQGAAAREKEALGQWREGEARAQQEEAGWKAGLREGMPGSHLEEAWRSTHAARRQAGALRQRYRERQTQRAEKEKEWRGARRVVRTYERLAERAREEARIRVLSEEQKALDEAAILRWKGGDA